MCVAIAGQVLALCGDTARVSVRGNVTEVHVGLVTPEVGDFVLVHAGCALQILPDGAELEALLDEVLEASHEAP